MLIRPSSRTQSDSKRPKTCRPSLSLDGPSAKTEADQRCEALPCHPEGSEACACWHTAECHGGVQQTHCPPRPRQLSCLSSVDHPGGTQPTTWPASSVGHLTPGRALQGQPEVPHSSGRHGPPGKQVGRPAGCRVPGCQLHGMPSQGAARLPGGLLTSGPHCCCLSSWQGQHCHPGPDLTLVPDTSLESGRPWSPPSALKTVGFCRSSLNREAVTTNLRKERREQTPPWRYLGRSKTWLPPSAVPNSHHRASGTSAPTTTGVIPHITTLLSPCWRWPACLLGRARTPSRIQAGHSPSSSGLCGAWTWSLPSGFLVPGRRRERHCPAAVQDPSLWR